MRLARVAVVAFMAGVLPPPGVSVQDEGSGGVRVGTINFVGAGVSASSSAGVSTVTIGGGGSDPWTIDTVSADTSAPTTSDVAITGLSVGSLAASTNYLVRCWFTTSAAAATTGVQITPAGPASPSQLTWTRQSCASTTTVRNFQGNTYAIDAATASAGTTRCIEAIVFHIRNGSNAGSVTFSVRSEVAASSVTVFNGSYCEWRTY